jgi:hypothetical protein
MFVSPKWGELPACDAKCGVSFQLAVSMMLRKTIHHPRSRRIRKLEAYATEH